MITAKDIINWADGMHFVYNGDENLVIDGFSSLNHYKTGSITWIKNLKNVKDLQKITCAVVQEGIHPRIDNYFSAKNSKEFFFGMLQHFFANNKKIAERAGSYIGEGVRLDEDVIIGCNCTLDGDIKIGCGTVIEHNVTIINNVTIGENCIIHSGTVIGKDGFGYSFNDDNIPVKVQHFGGVTIGDRVEIGANCNVDRGTIDNTIIEDDVKIDSFSQIAHNVVVKKGTLIIGAMVAGSSIIGEKSYLAPKSVIKNQCSIGNNTFIGMGVVVTKSVGDNCMVVSWGNKMQSIDADDYREWL